MTNESTSKKQYLLDLLDHGLIMLHIDARHADIEVPPYLKGDPHLCINLSYRFGISDLDITDEAISVTLSFQKTPYHCHLPMAAIWGVSQPPAPGMQLFFDAMPPELLLQMMVGPDEEGPNQAEAPTPLRPIEASPAPTLSSVPTAAPATSETTTEQPAPKERPALRLVVDNTDTPEPPPATTPPPPSKRPHLRIVPTPNTEDDQE
jgi:stringent starvation protein B